MRHGTGHAYSRLKCRCDECRDHNRERSARWRRSKRRSRETGSPCIFCGYLFHPKGLGMHEQHCKL